VNRAILDPTRERQAGLRKSDVDRSSSRSEIERMGSRQALNGEGHEIGTLGHFHRSDVPPRRTTREVVMEHADADGHARKSRSVSDSPVDVEAWTDTNRMEHERDRARSVDRGRQRPFFDHHCLRCEGVVDTGRKGDARLPEARRGQ
jgi:hypothetical protein